MPTMTKPWPRPHASTCPFWGFATFFALTAAACTPSHIVSVRAAPEETVQAPVQALQAYVRSFEARTSEDALSGEDTDLLRNSFVDYLTTYCGFGAVHIEAPEDLKNVVVFDVVSTATYTSKVDWGWAWPAVYPMPGYWPIQPVSGKATVSVALTASDGHGGFILRTAGEGEAEYSITVYGWYRTGAIEEAYQKSYAASFVAAASNLRRRHDTLLTHYGLAPEDPWQGPKEKIVVLTKLQGDTGATPTIHPDMLEDHVMASLQKKSRFQPIGRTDLDTLIDFEKQKELLGCDGVVCMAEIGGALGADWLLANTVTPLENGWSVTLKLISAKDVNVGARASQLVEGGQKELLDAYPHLIRQLMNQQQATVAGGGS